MKIFIITLTFLFSATFFAQQTVSGKIVDAKNNPLQGANVYLEGTYDGVSSDENGNFKFLTNEKGQKTLVVTFLNYENFSELVDIKDVNNKTIKLNESVNTLDAVVINAGSFEAGGRSKVSILKPLDIVTTAGSNADIVAALQTLGGTQVAGESGRLLVRGGEDSETQTFVDGIRVAQPYGASAANTPARGRFSPFLFSGMSFSTGGYSAEYGEALSSVLLLNTEDEAKETKTELSFMTVGLGAALTSKCDKSSISSNVSYINLAPYQLAIPQDIPFKKPFQSVSGESVYRYAFRNGILKVYAAFDNQTLNLDRFNLDTQSDVNFDLRNNNFYFNSSYNGVFGNGWQLTTGMSYGFSQNKICIVTNNIKNGEHATHFKLKFKNNITERIKISFGADLFTTKFDENFRQPNGFQFNSGYQSNIAATFAEADIFLSKKFAIKGGVRFSNNDYINKFDFSPRVSLAYKLTKSAQMSFAYGEFAQAPRPEFLKYNSQFDSEKASHFILNYLYSKKGQTFRAEIYEKQYSDLVKFNTQNVQFNTQFNNNGSGFARGVDLLWRDNTNIKNLEYWFSYSYIDSQRDYRNFPKSVTPSFVANHTASFVTKYWISDWKSQIGFTNTFATGRPYNNPNEQEFMNSKTKAFNNLAFNWAYLLTTQKIIYFSVTNVLGNQNVFGYDYAANPNSQGVYASRPVVPTADRFFFVGFFWTISKNKADNQLRNL